MYVWMEAPVIRIWKVRFMFLPCDTELIVKDWMGYISLLVYRSQSSDQLRVHELCVCTLAAIRRKTAAPVQLYWAVGSSGMRIWKLQFVIFHPEQPLPTHSPFKMHSLVKKKSDLGQTKKVSASTNMAQFFTGGRSVFFFAEIFFTCKSGMPTSTFQEQGTATLVPVASLPEERRHQSRPGRACVCWAVGQSTYVRYV